MKLTVKSSEKSACPDRLAQGICKMCKEDVKMPCQCQDACKPKAAKLWCSRLENSKLRDDILTDKQLFASIIHFICSAPTAGAIDNKIEQAMVSRMFLTFAAWAISSFALSLLH